MQKRSAFTLIELLVVISIIALLVAILMPALNTARGQAQATQCVMNQKNLTLGWFMYQDDNEGRLPGGDAWFDGWHGVEAPWVQGPTNKQGQSVDLNTMPREEWITYEHWGIKNGSMYRYMDEALEVYHCPADKRVFEDSIGYRSYSIAGIGSSVGVPPRADDWGWGHYFVVIQRYSQLDRPSSKYVFVEEAQSNTWNQGTWVMDMVGRRFHDPIAPWHNVVCTLGFADGHAEKIKWQHPSTVDWLQNDNRIIHPGNSDYPDIANEDKNPDLRYMLRGYPTGELPY